MGKKSAAKEQRRKRAQRSEPRESVRLSPLYPGTVKCLAWLFCLLLVGAAIYRPALSGGFVFDDGRAIVNNHYLRLEGFSGANRARLRHILRNNRALPLFTFALNYYWGGLDPYGYKLVNLLIHLLTGVVLFWLTLVMLNLPRLRERYGEAAYKAAVFASLIFVVHPVNIQGVSYTVQRMTALACLFYLLTLLCYLCGRLRPGPGRRGLWAGAALCALCAFKSKENTLTLPMVIVACEWFFFPGDGRRLKRLWPLLLLPLAVGYYYTGFDLKDVLYREAALRHIPYTGHLLTQARVIVHYLGLIVFPHPARLNLDYDFAYSLGLFNPPGTFFSLLFLLGLAAAAIFFYKKSPFFTFCLLWFFGNLAIESLLVLADVAFEHRLYLPAVGLWWIGALAVIGLYHKLIAPGPRFRYVGLFIISGLILLPAWWTHRRNLVWADPVALWEDTAAKSPRKVRPRNNLANAYGSRGRYEEALEQCRRALELDPSFAPVYHNMGMIYSSMGDKEKAKRAYLKAVSLEPGLLEAQNNLALIYLEEGEYEKALTGFEFLVRQKPLFTTARNNLGNAYHKLGRLKEAERSFRRVLEIDPAFGEARLNLGVIRAQQGKIKEALAMYRSAALSLPGSAEVYANLGQAYYLLGKGKEARKAWRRALELNPDMPQPHFGLARSAAAQKRYGEAVEAYQKAILLAPEWVDAYNELANLYYMLNRYDDALELYGQALRLDPGAVNIYNNLGLVHTARGEYDKAIAEHLRAAQIEPSSPIAYNHLSLIYLHYLKRPAAALKYLKLSLAADPGQPEADRLRATAERLEEEGGFR